VRDSEVLSHRALGRAKCVVADLTLKKRRARSGGEEAGDSRRGIRAANWNRHGRETAWTFSGICRGSGGSGTIRV